MASMAPPPGAGPVVPRKKVSPIVWIVVGILGFFLLVAVGVVAGGIFLAKKIADNPTLAAATAIAAANPDIEVLSSDNSKGTVTFREKSSGKTVTMNFDQLQKGKFVFSEDGKEVTVEAGEGGIHAKASDGSTVDIGTGTGKLPDWVPSYPGANKEGAFSASSDSEQSATLTFTTKDSAEKVVKFFEDGFKQAGMKVTQSTFQEGGKFAGGILSAQSEDSKRQAAVNLSVNEDGVNVALTYSTKK